MATISVLETPLDELNFRVSQRQSITVKKVEMILRIGMLRLYAY
jgi:hypothetical protein